MFEIHKCILFCGEKIMDQELDTQLHMVVHHNFAHNLCAKDMLYVNTCETLEVISDEFNLVRILLVKIIGRNT
jgi:hypothetical protein